jgi:hypothetical protein
MNVTEFVLSNYINELLLFEILCKLSSPYAKDSLNDGQKSMQTQLKNSFCYLK